MGNDIDATPVATGVAEADKGTLWRKPTKFEEACRINFAQRRTFLDDRLEATTQRMVQAVRDMEDDIVHSVKSKKLLQMGDAAYQYVKDIYVNPKPIKDICLNSFVYMYFVGKSDALTEMRAASGEPMKFSARDGLVVAYSLASFAKDDDDIAAVKPSEALDQFQKRVPVSKKEFGQMLAREKADAFTIAGIVEKDIMAQVQRIIFKAIDQGWTLTDFQYAIRQVGIQYTGTVYGTDKRKGQPLTPWHTETILRTNFSDVYNRGRWLMFNDPDLGDFVPALQYSAILDTRTRETHRQMDGKIYPKDDPLWKIWNPPCGYNCRCMLVPITSNEEYTISELTNLKPDPGFGGVAEEVTSRVTAPRIRI